MINFDQINRGLFIGSYPQSPVDIDRLKNGPRVTAVVNLQSDIDIRNLGIDWPKLMERYLKHDIAVLRIPIFDFDPEDLTRHVKNAAAQVGALERAGHRIYLHCTAGVGRAPGVAIGHLVWNHGWDLDLAYRFVRDARTCDPYIEAIRAAQ